jgi:hypothetical protein
MAETLRTRVFQRSGFFGGEVVQWPRMRTVVECSQRHRTVRAADRCAQRLRRECEYAEIERNATRHRAAPEGTGGNEP